MKNYKSLSLTQQDISETGLAIQSFPGAYGSANSAGEFKSSIADDRMLVLFVPITSASMTVIWRACGIATDANSSFAAMQSSPDHCIDVYFFKVRCGWFGSVWVGNVKLHFAKSQIAVGCISGSTQAAMWHQLREFIDNGRKLYESTDAAITAIAAR